MNIPEAYKEKALSIITIAEEELSVLVGRKVTLDARTEKLSQPDQLIRTLVCDYFGITWRHILQRTRNRTIVSARQCYCYLANGHTENKPPKIADILGVDRTTVIHSISKIKNLLWAKDSIVMPAIISVEEKIMQYNNSNTSDEN